MTFKLPSLEYDLADLEPYMSKETLEFHYEKHHKGYVDKLNELIKGTKYESMSLEAIIKDSEGVLFNNAAQHWNHSFFWKCLCKGSFKKPKGQAESLINEYFIDFNSFKEEFNKKALANFGSGWTWLVLNKEDKLEIINTSNAENPINNGFTPILVCDLWEHAYYIDHRNSRPNFLENYWNLVDWDFVNYNLAHSFPHL